MTKEEIYQFFVNQYIQSGPIYSGSIPLNHHLFYNNKAAFDSLLELWDAGMVVRRDCEAMVLELPALVRAELINNHNLAERWQASHACFYPNDPLYGEVAEVRRAAKGE